MNRLFGHEELALLHKKDTDELIDKIITECRKASSREDEMYITKIENEKLKDYNCVVITLRYMKQGIDIYLDLVRYCEDTYKKSIEKYGMIEVTGIF